MNEYGVCQYCGQVKLAREEGETQGEADLRATAECECPGARVAMRKAAEEEAAKAEREEKIGRAQEEIKALTMDTEETYGVASLHDETARTLMDIAVLIIDKQLTGISAQKGRTKITIKKNGKGELKIERTDALKYSAEV